jgi:hypothetical protein
VRTDDGWGRRTRREAKTNPGRSLELKIGGHGSVILDCDNKTAKCFQFYCVLGELQGGKSMVIKIRARLWHTTFLEDYTDKKEVLIFSKAELKIDPSLHIQQLSLDNDISKAMTVAYPGKDVQEPEGIPIWVIIVGVLVGVLILVCLIILLWKCGFFRRQKHDEMVQHKGKVEKNPDDEYHD